MAEDEVEEMGQRKDGKERTKKSPVNQVSEEIPRTCQDMFSKCMRNSATKGSFKIHWISFDYTLPFNTRRKSKH